ncbi:MAG: GYF domain-containing protein [Candidatus Sumerlaeota bacterium]
MDWYYAKNGEQLGPVSEETLRGLRQSGQVDDQTLIWAEGMAEWRPYLETLGKPADAVETGMRASREYENAAARESFDTRPIENYMTRSIVVTVVGFLCCQISMALGIVGIVFAAQCNDAMRRQDYARAAENSERAKQFSTIGMWLLIPGFLIFGIVFIFQILAALA